MQRKKALAPAPLSKDIPSAPPLSLSRWEEPTDQRENGNRLARDQRIRTSTRRRPHEASDQKPLGNPTKPRTSAPSVFFTRYIDLTKRATPHRARAGGRKGCRVDFSSTGTKYPHHYTVKHSSIYPSSQMAKSSQL